jgi:cytidine deaminase
MLQGISLEEDAQLIEVARAVCGEFALRGDFSAGSVGAAIRTAKGNIYTGICIDLACGLGFCAEVAAVAEMLKHRETHIATIVAISREGVPGAPCGRCREMIAQVDARNLESRVLLGGKQEARLHDLLPQHWLTDSSCIQT